MADKRRRSPRLSREASPSPKRKRLEKTPTIELAEEPSPERTVIRTSSSLQQATLLRRLSSIIDPTKPSEPDDIPVAQELLGFGAEVEFANDDVRPLARMSYEVWIVVCAYLGDQDRWALATVCKRMNFIICSFVGLSYQLLPIPVDLAMETGRKNFLAIQKDIPDRTITNCDPGNRALTAFPDQLESEWFVYLEARLLGQHLETKGDLPKETEKALKLLCQGMLSVNRRTPSLWLEPNRGVLGLRASCQPEGLQLNLYEYQASNLSWMLSIESAVSLGQKFTFSTLVRAPCSLPLVMDVYDLSLPVFPSSGVNPEDYQASFTTQGGILADEMGLGKTISMLALILSNPRPMNEEGEFTRGPTAHELSHYSSGATLVVCPNHLVSQWKKELTTHSDLLVYSVATTPQHRKITYEMVVEADVVIVSTKLLESEAYCALSNARTGKSSVASLNNTRKPDPEEARPVFGLIDWHRIIVDEAHEDPWQMQRTCGPLVSTYRWCVTGTPFPRGFGPNNSLLEFINFRMENKPSHPPAHSLMANIVRRTLFRRHTKASVDLEVTIPSLEEKINLVPLNRVQQAMYDAEAVDCDEDSLRRIVRDGLYPCLQNLERAARRYAEKVRWEQKYIDMFRMQLVQARRDLDAALGHLPRAAATVNQIPVAQLRRNLANLEKRYNKVRNLLVHYLCRHAIFTRLVQGEDDEIDTACDQCAAPSASRAELPCHHFVCAACLGLSQETDTCVVCANAFATDLIGVPDFLPFPTKEGKLSLPHLEEEQSVYDHAYMELRRTCGTKLAAVIRYLQDTLESDEQVKVIVFSQHDSELQRLRGELLQVDKSYADRILVCRGNVNAKARQLEEFNSTEPGSPRILMMSLKTSAAGAHLPVATHVLLLDPVVGHSGDVKATDAQAIARAHRIGQDKPVFAIRFIVPNTIEQKDYENAYGMLRRPGPRPKSARSAVPR